MTVKSSIGTTAEDQGVTVAQQNGRGIGGGFHEVRCTLHPDFLYTQGGGCRRCHEVASDFECHWLRKGQGWFEPGLVLDPRFDKLCGDLQSGR